MSDLALATGQVGKEFLKSKKDTLSMKESYLFFCSRCDMWSTGQSNDLLKFRFKCFYCANVKKVFIRSRREIIFKGPFGAKEAMMICKEVNMQKSMQK